MNAFTKTRLATALVAAMGLSESATADIIDMTYSGWFTMLDVAGTSAVNSPYEASGAPMYGYRTPISGSMTFDTVTGAGSATMAPFNFLGPNSPFEVDTISLQAIGDGMGNAGPLLLLNTTYSWHATTSIPMSAVLDASGLLSAIGAGVTAGDTIAGTGALAATDNFGFDFGKLGTYTLPMGPSPLVTTTFNTTDIGTVALGSNPSGTLPLTDDGIGGSPMRVGPFPGFNSNFDFTSMDVVSVTAVPAPAALWLFGSGLLGLIGVARKKRLSDNCNGY